MNSAMPPLNGLKAFEAAARHRSFTRAAQELHVTTGALSHQVRGLEEFLGVRLFERSTRSIALTEYGKLLQPGLQAGFGLIRDAVAELRSAGDQRSFVISTPPGFTSKWLVPRLFRLSERLPDCDIRVSASATPASFAADRVDAAIRNLPDGFVADETLVYTRLIGLVLVPVCSPALLGKRGAGRSARLDALALIHDDSLKGRPGSPDWAEYFRQTGVKPPKSSKRGLHLSSPDHAIDAALGGSGALLAHSILVEDDVKAGRLACPWKAAMAIPRAYYLVHPKAREKSRQVQGLKAWLQQELASMDAAFVKPADS